MSTDSPAALSNDRSIAPDDATRLAKLSRVGVTEADLDPSLTVILQDAAGLILDVTAPSGGHVFGWTSEDLVNRAAPELLHPDDREVASRLREHVRVSGGNQSLQIRVRSKNGRWVWAQVDFSAMVETDGSTGSMTVAVLRDASAEHLDIEVLGLLLEMRGLIASAASVEDAWTSGLQRLGRIGGFVAASVFEKGESGFAVAHQWNDGTSNELRPSVDLAHTQDVLQAVYTNGQRLRAPIGDVDSDPDRSDSDRTALYVPVAASDGSVVGVVELIALAERTFNDSLIGETVVQLGDAILNKQTEQRLQLAELEFRAAFEHAAIGTALVSTSGSFTRANGALCDFLGRTAEELEGLHIRTVTHPDDAAQAAVALRSMIDGLTESYVTEKRYLRADGDYVWGLLSTTLVRDHSGAPVHFIAQIQDINDRKTVERLLRRTEARFRAAFDDSAVAMALVSLRRTDSGALLEANSAFRDLSDGAESGTGRLDDLVHLDDRQAVRQHLARLDQPDPYTVSQLARANDPGPQERWLRVTASPVLDGDVEERFAIVHVEEITAQLDAEREMARLALHDPLTGLANRGLILDKIRDAQVRSERSGHHVGLLFIDLDQFKQINDTHGHLAGDRALQQVAECLTISVRPGDTVARLGGDEFVVLCDALRSNETQAEAELGAVANRVRHAIDGTVFDGTAEQCGASIGTALVKGTATDAALALNEADQSMYRDKRATRNTEI